MSTLKPQDVRVLAAVAMCDQRTVVRAYSGKPVKTTTLARLEQAAAIAKLPGPSGIRETQKDAEAVIRRALS